MQTSRCQCGFGGGCLAFVFVIAVFGVEALGVETLFPQVAHQHGHRAVGDHDPFGAGVFRWPRASPANRRGRRGRNRGRRRAVGGCRAGSIQPLAKPSLNSPKRRIQVLPPAEGGAMIRALAQTRVGFFQVAGIVGSGHAHASFAVDAVERFHGAVD